MNVVVKGVGHPTFTTLQVGRGLASLMVVICHIGVLVGNEPGLWERHQISDITVVGAFGVDFFFILSGIVILLAHWNDIGRPAKVPLFFWKRIRRIYPIYWVLLVPLIFKSVAIHSYKIHSIWIVLSNLLLVHIKSMDTIMGPSWTLFHEILFYALFSILIYKKPLGLAVLAAWLGASAFFFHNDAVVMFPTNYSLFVFSPLHLLFGFGMLVALAIHFKYVTQNIWVCAAGISAFIISLTFTIGPHRPQILWIRMVGDVGLAIGVWAAMAIEISRKVKFPASLRLLGDASYSLYLSHFMVLSIIARTLHAHDHRLHTPLGLVMIIMFVSAIIAGILIHLWVEAPLLRLLSRGKAKNRHSSLEPAGTYMGAVQ